MKEGFSRGLDESRQVLRGMYERHHREVRQLGLPTHLPTYLLTVAHSKALAPLFLHTYLHTYMKEGSAVA